MADGFDAMGKTVSLGRRQAGYDFAKECGLSSDAASGLVNGMAELLERDKPYEAMKVGEKHLDLTGNYRMMATLLTD